MRKVMLVSDSAMDIPAHYIKEHQIKIVPFYISFGDKTYRDGVDITTKELYEKVEKLGQLPKTGAISPAEWKKVFDTYVDAGYDVLCMTIGSKLSSSFQNAYLMSLEYDQGRVEVLDTKALSGSISILMLKAIDLRNEGKSATEIKQALELLVPKVHTQFVIPTLDYLYKGGRCSAMSKVFGTMLAIKPQIKMFDGTLELYKKSVGKMSRSVDGMLEDFFKMANEGKVDLEYVFITHTMAQKMHDYIKEKVVASGLPIKNLLESHAGSVISSHCGPGTIGILYLEK